MHRHFLPPFYIVAPPYSRFSAGIKVIHQLCHLLNLSGRPTYLIVHGDRSQRRRLDVTQADLLTPVLTQHIARAHFEKGFAPIYIYPEIVTGNPYKAQCIIRYLLNYADLRDECTENKRKELIYSYSKSIAKFTNYPNNVLFIPCSDPHIFHAPHQNNTRTGSYYYINKSQSFVDAEFSNLPKDCIRINGDEFDALTQEQLAEIFRHCEFFYTFENTSLALDAALCGCPTVFIPNKSLTNIIASDEIGLDGFAWGADPVEMERAKATVHKVRTHYQNSLDQLPLSLQKFIKGASEHFPLTNYDKDSYYELIPQLLPAGDLFDNRQITGFDAPDYAPIFKKLPPWLEREIGLLLCRLGLKNDGEYLWNRGSSRLKNWQSEK
jgi:hypothetical protein